MKKFLSAIIAAVMTLAVISAPASAEIEITEKSAGKSSVINVDYELDESYTVTIPASVTFTDTETTVEMYSVFAQEESQSISNNCRMGVHKRMAEGIYKSHTVPYGYDLINGQMVINEQKAEIVKEIFNMFLNGHGAYEIANYLNQKNVPVSQYAKKWNHTTIMIILRNEKYIGDTLFQKRYTTDTLPAYYTEHSGQLDRKLLTLQNQLHSLIGCDEDDEEIEGIKLLISIFETAEPITEFDEVLFSQIVEKIIVTSDTELRFRLSGGVEFTEKIRRKERRRS